MVILEVEAGTGLAGLAPDWSWASCAPGPEAPPWRRTPPSATVRRVAPLMPRVGVTRVAEVTHLDRSGLPNFVAARPREPGAGISYYNGKGAARSQARAGAMMEAIERYSGERCELPVVVASFDELRRDAPAVDPAELIIPRSTDALGGLPLEWVLGHDLLSDRPTYVPLNAVVCPYRPARGEGPFWASTNGLAAGNHLAEATCQALCEINERDAMSLFHARTRLRDGVAGLLGRAGCAAPADPGAVGEHPRVDPAGLPPRARRLYDRLTASGLRIYLRDMTSATGIAAVECNVVERLGSGRHAAHFGFGCHPDAGVAVRRALIEASQTRLSFIQGGREDLPEMSRALLAEDPERRFGAGPLRPFAAMASARLADARDAVRWMLDRFRAAGFPQVVVVDLTRPELGIPVVRAVVPRAETWAIYQMHLNTAAIGPRALAQLA